jgi:hypothetical protein
MARTTGKRPHDRSRHEMPNLKPSFGYSMSRENLQRFREKDM